jgi:hypothetical protein
MLARERACRLELPENASTRLEEVVVEQALVVAALPTALVELRERVAAPLHAREPGFLHARLCFALHARLQAGCHGHPLARDMDGGCPSQDPVEQLQDLARRLRLDHLSCLLHVL